MSSHPALVVVVSDGEPDVTPAADWAVGHTGGGGTVRVVRLIRLGWRGWLLAAATGHDWTAELRTQARRELSVLRDHLTELSRGEVRAVADVVSAQGDSYLADTTAGAAAVVLATSDRAVTARLVQRVVHLAAASPAGAPLVVARVGAAGDGAVTVVLRPDQPVASARVAVRTADAEATALGCPLRVVLAEGPVDLDQEYVGLLCLDALVAHVAPDSAQLTVSTAADIYRDVVLTESATARAVVVATADTAGELRDLDHVVRHTACPVLVVVAASGRAGGAGPP